MRIKNSFDAADLALCRAHGDAAAHDANIRALVRQLAPIRPAAIYRMACDDFERVTLDQAQSDAYWQWQHEVHAPTKEQIVDAALERLADPSIASQGAAYVSAKQPDQAEVWHSEPPAVAGVYVACHATQTMRPNHYAHWSGEDWTITYETPSKSKRGRAADHISDADDFLWLRLVEADKPAEAPAPAAATHSVCTKAHSDKAGMARRVGEVLPQAPVSRSYPKNWLPCDKDGWVSHTPTADSVCPVPWGVAYEDRLENGLIGRPRSNHPKWNDRQKEGFRITAWRPTGTAA